MILQLEKIRYANLCFFQFVKEEETGAPAPFNINQMLAEITMKVNSDDVVEGKQFDKDTS